MTGLVVGKVVGISGASWLARRAGGLPLTVPWAPMVGAATVAGIGFSVSLLVADISLEGEQLTEAKLGILAAAGPPRSRGARFGSSNASPNAAPAPAWLRRSRTSPTLSILRSTTSAGPSTRRSSWSSTATSSAPTACGPRLSSKTSPPPSATVWPSCSATFR